MYYYSLFTPEKTIRYLHICYLFISLRSIDSICIHVPMNEPNNSDNFNRDNLMCNRVRMQAQLIHFQGLV